MPANFWWTNLTGNSLASEVRNWSSDADEYRLPGEKDDVVFGYVDFKIGPADCLDLRGPFQSVHVRADYNGTVRFGGSVQTTDFFRMEGGAIAQDDRSEDLTVNGLFTWTGGVLNSTPSDAAVNVYGGGSITLPGDGYALITGSTLNFGNVDSSGSTIAQTIISGAGTLFLTGTDPLAINTQPNAGVVVPLQASKVTNFDALGPGAKTITIAANSYWGYVGVGNNGPNGYQNAVCNTVGLNVENKGGYFFVGSSGQGETVQAPAQARPNLPGGPNAGLSRVTLTINSGNGGPGYTQTQASSILEINGTCVLDVSQTKGVSVAAGRSS